MFPNQFRDHVQLLKGVACILGLQDADQGLTALDEQLKVVLDPWSQPEFAICRDEFYFVFKNNVGAGGAGFRSISQLHNDSVDVLVTVLPGSIFSVAAGQSVALSRGQTLCTTDDGLIAIPLDTRAPRGVSGVRARHQNGVALPAGFPIIWDPQQVVHTIPWAITLRPGQTLSAFPNADNQAVNASFYGRARRVVNQRELNL